MRLPRSTVLLFAIAAAAACAPTNTNEPRERVTSTGQRFTSQGATLLDFEFDGRLVAHTNDPGALRVLIGAQLMYSVGQLNGDYSTGHHERLELSAITANPSAATADRYDVSYHAKLPVAWGRPPPTGALPTSYQLILPAGASEADQIAFAAKYGQSCIHPDSAAGPSDPAQLFIYYRPQNPDCRPAEGDVVRLFATVTRSTSNTTGKYPEYHRIWDDGALRVVAVFTRFDVVESSGSDDEGVHARDAFLALADDYVRALDPGRTADAAGPASSLRATLADGRRIVLDVRLVAPRLASEDAAFDAWYDALTPEADVIFFNGHAGLGENIRALMKKGTFRAGKYVIWTLNGCDTFAYVDRTLADRRALLNPDDAAGTRYMDVVSNVLSGTFDTTPETSMTLIDAIVQGRDLGSKAKTYRDMFEDIDPLQLVAVTGEEDNELQPSAGGAALPSARLGVDGPGGNPGDAGNAGDSGCSAAPGSSARRAWPALVASLLLGALAARRRRASA